MLPVDIATGSVLVVGEASAWTWGPETFVAIGTIGLAVVTGCLAAATLWVASETRAVARGTQSEILAQFRPVLAVIEGRYMDHLLTPQAGILVKAADLIITVNNCGQGPALATRIGLDFDPNPPAPDQHTGTAIPPGTYRAWQWQSATASFPKAVTGWITYRDLADTEYRTTFTLHRDGGAGGVTQQQVTRL